MKIGGSIHDREGKMAFTKMKSLCELKELQTVYLDSSYKNDEACATFMEFI